ncbi:hypothetical protein UFOVP134_8 [uncultured Caudovirales phage]|uniref:Uncharacterized protein n=1 Tax=uncultured Caudovirales phage TaxID=2100421 RepID=A0A6J5LK80_9CAUD|nr:hypothetical protein UFOVP134_8 [uncultured Caudovirales phage]
MVGLLEGLEDWGVKTAVDKVLDNYMKPVPPSKVPLITPADRPAFEKVAIDITNAVLEMIAQKVETPNAGS